jgi:hypothetical protein
MRDCSQQSQGINGQNLAHLKPKRVLNCFHISMTIVILIIVLCLFLGAPNSRISSNKPLISWGIEATAGYSKRTKINAPDPMSQKGKAPLAVQCNPLIQLP